LGTRLTAVVLLPATAAYLVLGRPLAITLFQFGSYTHGQAVDTGWVIAAAGLGLVPFAISQLQLFAFYAMPDTKTPAVINIPVVAVRIGLDILLFVALPLAWVVSGLMIGSTVSFAVAVLIGYVLLRRRIGSLDLTRVFGTVGRLTVAAAIAAVPTGLAVYAMVHMWGESKAASAAELVIGAIVLIAVYVAAAFALRVREVRELGDMVRARLGR
jgi:putative peptidoglycan lipid II flippase